MSIFTVVYENRQGVNLYPFDSMAKAEVFMAQLVDVCVKEALGELENDEDALEVLGDRGEFFHIQENTLNGT